MMDWNYSSKIILALYSISSLLSLFYLAAIRSNIDRHEQIMKEKKILGGIVKILSFSFLFLVFSVGLERIIHLFQVQSGINHEYINFFTIKFFFAFLLSFLITTFIVKIYHEAYLFKRYRFISIKKFEAKKIPTAEGLKNELERIKTNCPNLISTPEGHIPFSKLTFFHILQKELQERNISDIARNRSEK